MNKFKVSCKEELAEIIREGTPQLYNIGGKALAYDESLTYIGKSPYCAGVFAIEHTWKSLDVYTKPDLLADATPENPALSWVCDMPSKIGNEDTAVECWPEEHESFNYIDKNGDIWFHARLVTSDDLAKGEQNE